MRVTDSEKQLKKIQKQKIKTKLQDDPRENRLR